MPSISRPSLTREAVSLYRQRLKPSGVIALHLSNSHLDLRPVVARIATDLGLQLAYVADVAGKSEASRVASTWVLLAEDRRVLDLPPIAQATSPLPPASRSRPPPSPSPAPDRSRRAPVPGSWPRPRSSATRAPARSAAPCARAARGSSGWSSATSCAAAFATPLAPAHLRTRARDRRREPSVRHRFPEGGGSHGRFRQWCAPPHAAVKGENCNCAGTPRWAARARTWPSWPQR